MPIVEQNRQKALQGLRTASVRYQALLTSVGPTARTDKEIAKVRRALKWGRAPRDMSIDAINYRVRKLNHASRNLESTLNEVLATGVGDSQYLERPLAAGNQLVAGRSIGRNAPARNTSQGVVRATLIKPVLSGAFSASQAAGNWRLVIAGLPPKDMMFAEVGMPDGSKDLASQLSPRSLQRWAQAVQSVWKEEDRLGLPRTAAEDILTHRKPAGWNASRSYPNELVEKIRDMFLGYATAQNSSPSPMECPEIKIVFEAAGIDCSLRKIQRVVAGISDFERAMARGGPAATDVLFRAKLLREVRAPNQVWIMDHSWIGQRYKGQDCGHFDFETEVACVQYNRYGQPVRQRSGVHMTAIIDACTRRVLCKKVWPKVPTAREVLVCLFDAALKYGLPDVLYTDNGADFKSKEVASALREAGILQVFSRPYSPEGRGKVERLFRTIKEKLMPWINGYVGGRNARIWSEAELDTLEILQDKVVNLVDALINDVVHSRTGKKPAEHFDTAVGSRRFIRDPNKLLNLLLHKPDVIRQTQGIRLNNAWYYSSCLQQIMMGRPVRVYHDPFTRDRAHVAVVGSEGTIEYQGPVERYGDDKPTPDFETLQRDVATNEREQLSLQHARQADFIRSQSVAGAIEDSLEIIATVGSVSEPTPTFGTRNSQKLLPSVKPQLAPTAPKLGKDVAIAEDVDDLSAFNPWAP